MNMKSIMYKHLTHPFYERAKNLWTATQRGQILKGAAKYPEPFDPNSWTSKELLEHALQENVDQVHYMVGLFDRIVDLETKLSEAERTIEQLKKDHSQ